MQKIIWILAALYFCVSCSTGENGFSVPDIPQGDRQPLIQKQLISARSQAVQHKDNPEALGQFAMVMHAYVKPADSGLATQAELLYAQARKLAPDEFRWAYLHGLTLDVLGLDTQARDAFAAAARISPQAGSTGLGASLRKLGETGAAREALQTALAYDASDARTLYELGRLASDGGDWPAAQDYLLKSVATGARQAAVFYALGEVYNRQGDEEKAAEYFESFEQARQQSPGWPDPWLAKVKTFNISDRRLISAAELAIKEKDFARAVLLTEQARLANPDNTLPAVALISLYALVGENDKSDEALSIARVMDPDSANLYYNIGIARLAQKRRPEAIEALLRVTEIDPQGTLAWKKLASIYTTDRETDKAIDALEQAHKRQPADPELRVKLGTRYTDAKRYELALALLDTRAGSDRLEAQRLWALGRVHRHLGNIEQAATLLAEAQAAAQKAGDRRMTMAVATERDRLKADISNESGT